MRGALRVPVELAGARIGNVALANPTIQLPPGAVMRHAIPVTFLVETTDDLADIIEAVVKQEVVLIPGLDWQVLVLLFDIADGWLLAEEQATAPDAIPDETEGAKKIIEDTGL